MIIMNNKELIPKSSYSFFTIVLSILGAMLLGVVLFESKFVSNIRSQVMHPILGIGLAFVFIYAIYTFTGKYVRIPLVGFNVDSGMFIYVCILVLILFTLG